MLESLNSSSFTICKPVDGSAGFEYEYPLLKFPPKPELALTISSHSTNPVSGFLNLLELAKFPPILPMSPVPPPRPNDTYADVVKLEVSLMSQDQLKEETGLW